MSKIFLFAVGLFATIIALDAPAVAQSDQFNARREDACGNDPAPACERAVRRLCGANPTRRCIAKHQKAFDRATRAHDGKPRG